MNKRLSADIRAVSPRPQRILRTPMRCSFRVEITRKTPICEVKEYQFRLRPKPVTRAVSPQERHSQCFETHRRLSATQDPPLRARLNKGHMKYKFVLKGQSPFTFSGQFEQFLRTN